jgi:AcrR family transcriptional regulator
VLAAALTITHETGVGSLTFSALAARCGLSAPTLVQRFSNKPTLIKRTLLYAWDQLEHRTDDLAATLPLTVEGAVDLLLGLSSQYAGADSFGLGLLLLREDTRDADLRARGAAWESQLVDALNERLASNSDDPQTGYALATYWQGAIVWWAYQTDRPLPDYLGEKLRLFIPLLASPRR